MPTRQGQAPPDLSSPLTRSSGLQAPSQARAAKMASSAAISDSASRRSKPWQQVAADGLASGAGARGRISVRSAAQAHLSQACRPAPRCHPLPPPPRCQTGPSLPSGPNVAHRSKSLQQGAADSRPRSGRGRRRARHLHADRRRRRVCLARRFNHAGWCAGRFNQTGPCPESTGKRRAGRPAYHSTAAPLPPHSVSTRDCNSGKVR